MDGENVNFEVASYTVPAGNLVHFQLATIGQSRSLFSWAVQKKIGKPEWNNEHGHFGIYQMRMTKRGKVPVRMRFYVPTNPRTEAQQANRSKFADAMAAWQGLTDEQKEPYNKRARARHMFGHNLFIREYMREN